MYLDGIFRLLKSLEVADYGFEKNNPHWRLILEIRIDVGGGEKVTFCRLTSALKCSA